MFVGGDFVVCWLVWKMNMAAAHIPSPTIIANPFRCVGPVFTEDCKGRGTRRFSGPSMTVGEENGEAARTAHERRRECFINAQFGRKCWGEFHRGHKRASRVCVFVYCSFAPLAFGFVRACEGLGQGLGWYCSCCCCQRRKPLLVATQVTLAAIATKTNNIKGTDCMGFDTDVTWQRATNDEAKKQKKNKKRTQRTPNAPEERGWGARIDSVRWPRCV